MILKHNVVDIRKHTFRKEDRVFLDANIWLFIYGPIPSRDWIIETYSNALKQILSSKALILLNVFVLNEFVNRFVKFEYEQLAPEKKWTFKDYRESDDFKDVAQEISIVVKKILKISTKFNYDFEASDVNMLLSRYEAGQLDFTDHLIMDCCELQDAILITHDKDFRNCKTPVLTANKNLFSCVA
jgi:hypothetical protein